MFYFKFCSGRRTRTRDLDFLIWSMGGTNRSLLVIFLLRWESTIYQKLFKCHMHTTRISIVEIRTSQITAVVQVQFVITLSFLSMLDPRPRFWASSLRCACSTTCFTNGGLQEAVLSQWRNMHMLFATNKCIHCIWRCCWIHIIDNTF